MTTPETTHLVPMTYQEAAQLFYAIGQVPFSFVEERYGNLKTAAMTYYGLCAIPPSAYSPAGPQRLPASPK